MSPSHCVTARSEVSAPRLLTIDQMLNRLDGIQGHSRAKRQLCTAVYNHYLIQVLTRETGEELAPQHTLLMGPSGSGKTLLVNTLAQALGVPFYRIAATSLVEVGYKGTTIDEAISAYLTQRCQGQARIAEQGILFIDEFDKLASCATPEFRDVSGAGAQNALLTVLDGRLTEVCVSSNQPRHDPVNTRRILFIFAGAFSGLAPIIGRRLQPTARKIGLKESPAEAAEVSTRDWLARATTEDLIEFGIIRELAGRFNNVVSLSALNRQDLRQILEARTGHSPLETQSRLAAVHGIELHLADSALEVMATQADELGLGARGLNRVVGELLADLSHRYSELAEKGINKVVIDDAVVRGETPPRELRTAQPKYRRRDVELCRVALADLPAAATANAAVAAKREQIPSSTPLNRVIGQLQLNMNDERQGEKQRREISFHSASTAARRWWSRWVRRNPQATQDAARRMVDVNATLNELYDCKLRHKRISSLAVLMDLVEAEAAAEAAFDDIELLWLDEPEDEPSSTGVTDPTPNDDAPF